MALSNNYSTNVTTAVLSSADNGWGQQDTVVFDMVAGETYTLFMAVDINSGIDLWDSNGNRAGDGVFSFVSGVVGSRVLSATSSVDVVGANFTVIAPIESFTVTTTTQDIDAMINDAFSVAKNYIDAKDAGLKAYTDAALDQLMNTTDLTAKLALLEQINSILDGDAATAGFQAWQSALTRLNAIETAASDYKTATDSSIQNISNNIQSSALSLTSKINANKTASDLADSAIAERVLTLETTTHSAVTTSVAAVQTNVTAVKDGVTANFAAMKAKAAILFAV